MSSSAELIAQLLLDAGLVAASGDWTVYVGLLPDMPDKASCVYDTEGVLDGRYMQTGERVVHTGIQIRVRGPEYSETYDKIRAISTYLDGVNRTTVVHDSVAHTIQNISRTSDIMALGLEEGERLRHHFTVNAVKT